MARGDSRKSPKMKRKISRRKFKERQQRKIEEAKKASKK